jgi:hypothetical protein
MYYVVKIQSKRGLKKKMGCKNTIFVYNQFFCCLKEFKTVLNLFENEIYLRFFSMHLYIIVLCNIIF